MNLTMATTITVSAVAAAPNAFTAMLPRVPRTVRRQNLLDKLATDLREDLVHLG